MARLFNIEVFNGTINGDATTPPTYYSSQEYANILGSADSLLAQVTVEGLTDSAGTVTVQYQLSNTNNNEDFQNSTNAATVAPGGTNGNKVPKSGFYLINSLSDLGAFGRFKITYNSATIVSVRITVCGRVN